MTPSTTSTCSRSLPLRSNDKAYTKSIVAIACRSSVVCALGLIFACNRSPAPGSGAGATASGSVVSAVAQRTTRGDIALRNLDHKISGLEKRAAKGSLDLPRRTQLVDALLTRTQFIGSFADFARVREVGESAVRDFPGNAKALLLRARAASAVHRFDDASKDIEAAAQLGADVDVKRASVSIARGQQLEAVHEFAENRLARAETIETLSLLANTEASLGEFDSADEHYAAALAKMDDASPFLVAQLSFQRGVMWAEQANRPERARPHYEEAVRRLPQYVVANVHLAELEAAAGQRDAAIERLRRLLDTRAASSIDPEPLGVLGSWLVAKDPNDAQGRELIERARAGYESLLAENRAAFLDHAAEFFSGPGKDPTRGLALSRENLAMRQTPRAHALAIDAAFHAQDVALGCQLVDSASGARAYSPKLAELIEREAERCRVR
jgi:tetratricopeptide (TPR) repeat protein